MGKIPEMMLQTTTHIRCDLIADKRMFFLQESNRIM